MRTVQRMRILLTSRQLLCPEASVTEAAEIAQATARRTAAAEIAQATARRTVAAETAQTVARRTAAAAIRKPVAENMAATRVETAVIRAEAIAIKAETASKSQHKTYLELHSYTIGCSLGALQKM